MEVLARPAGESPEAVSRIETGWSSTYEFKKSHRWNGKDELWYRIKISKESVQQFQVPVMVLPFVIQALVVYASERDVYSWGRFESDGRVGFKGYPIHMIPLNNINLDSPLYLRVGSGGANVGLIDGAFLGESATVRESYFWLGLPNLALWVLAMLIGFMSLFLYTATRENKTLLAYGLFALTIGTFVGSHSYTLRLATDWAKIRHSTELLSLYLSGLTFSLYLDTIFSAIDRFRIRV